MGYGKKECLAILKGHEDFILSLIQLHDGRIVSGSDDLTIKIWDLNSHKCTVTYKVHEDKVRPIIQLTDGKLLTSSNDRNIKLWEI